MARQSLKPQLNQIRAWVRQGRTDAWIAHQLDVSTTQLKEFRKQNGLDPESLGESPADLDLRDEIEAEIEAELEEVEDLPEPEEEDEPDTQAPEEEGERPGPARERRGGSGRSGERSRERSGDRSGDRSGSGRRRGRRGGRRRGKRGRKSLDATFEQGSDGYGLWLDPAIADDPVFKENWEGKRALRVTVEQGRIVLERDRD